MSTSFLDIIQQRQGGGPAAGDEFGGAQGHDGSGLPSAQASNFMFATGIECSYPTIQGGRVRRDQLEECGHYERWRDDLRLVKELGLRFLRYGLPYHRVHLGPGHYDWEFADQAMAELRRLGITPILDLLHFGVPDWLGNFQNPELPVHFAAYVEAVARRYPWVRYYTPVNEIYVTARASGRDGLWNEQLKSEIGFVTALKHATAANILACHAIARVRPDAIIVQSESAEFLHDASTRRRPEIALQNRLRFLAFDLLYSVPPDADICLYMMDNGLTREEYQWFMAGEPPGHQIMGNDYYGRNEKIVKPDGTVCIAEDVLGWSQITRAYYERYRKPVFHTETNVFDPEQAPAWLWKQWMNVLSMRQEGVPVLGFTWYSLIDQIDWDIQLAEQRGTVNACGLYDLNRQPRPVAAAYRELLEHFGQITLMAHGEFFEITDQPARLKVEV
ncbi:family 1 glycosylhydrolase [Deinococcus koreensis]|uniref:Glycoside hydrolase family 1 n=1 Tax=Deinococcus koreensis TaxID=2054903 RepID=A0A2K3USK5_9DEIO|nr:family 1 glycosylhydrolase [Deinococcus koreensis]PNY79525.1 glycoside hydrolase family 1 [Deinococcus koreensis]